MDKVLKKLYSNYKSMDDEDVKKHLRHILIVQEKNGDYYPIKDKCMSGILNDPRGKSLTFDVKLKKTPITGLEEIKTIDFLVKCSRFFLKPDVAEIFDQFKENNINIENVKAICVDSDDYETVNPDADNFVMKAKLMTNLKQIRKNKLNKLNEN